MSKKEEPKELNKEQLLEDINKTCNLLASLLQRSEFSHTMQIMICPEDGAETMSHLHLGGKDIYALAGMSAQGNLTMQNFIHGTLSEAAQAKANAAKPAPLDIEAARSKLKKV